jgi:DNA-binding XRE family transcriptional regulator
VQIVRKLRQEKNIPAKVLIDLLEISMCNYYKKEIGYLRFSLDEAKKLSEYFQMTIESIFFCEELSKTENYIV